MSGVCSLRTSLCVFYNLQLSYVIYVIVMWCVCVCITADSSSCEQDYGCLRTWDHAKGKVCLEETRTHAHTQCTHMHTHNAHTQCTHTCIHTHMSTHTHTRAHTQCTHMSTYTCTHTHTQCPLQCSPPPHYRVVALMTAGTHGAEQVSAELLFVLCKGSGEWAGEEERGCGW